MVNSALLPVEAVRGGRDASKILARGPLSVDISYPGDDTVLCRNLLSSDYRLNRIDPGTNIISPAK